MILRKKICLKNDSEELEHTAQHDTTMYTGQTMRKFPLKCGWKEDTKETRQETYTDTRYREVLVKE